MKTPEDFTNPKKPWEIEGIEWREVKLGEACIINPKKSEVKHLLNQNVEVSFIPMEYVDETQGKIVKMDTKPLQAVYKGYTYFKEGDVLFAKITPCMENGKSAIAHDLRNNIGFGSTEFHVLRPKENIASEFVFYFIRRKRFRNLAKLHFTGTVGHKRVPKEFLISAKISIPFRNDKPDLETQKKIVEYIEANFSRIDEILEKKKKELEQLDELLESVLEHAFKPKEGEEWREVRLKEVVKEVKSGFALSKRKRMKLSSEDGIPQLRPYNIANWNKIDLSQMTYVPMNMEGIEDYFIRVDDVLFNNTNSIELVGRAAVFKESSGKHTYSNHITRLRVRDLYFPEYISWAINSLWLKGVFYLKATKWIGQAGISNKKLLSIKIPIPFRNNRPGIEKQKEIANYLDDVYEKIKTLKEKIQRQITQLEEMKESILDEVFNHGETG